MNRDEREIPVVELHRIIRKIDLIVQFFIFEYVTLPPPQNCVLF